MYNNQLGELSQNYTEEKGIISLDELQSLEVLRTEFASSFYKPKVILGYDSISFNKACVKCCLIP
ncbi:MAG: hypothetical protein FWC20_12485, partial [Oscillospiraceae bacterium]|nr:hypothetical protein [Oscillospiraceae bacterium]